MRWKRKVKERARIFELVCWIDNPDFYDIVNKLKDISDTAICYHDKDIVTEETLQHFNEAGLVVPSDFVVGLVKTPHIHAVFRFHNARYTKAVRDEFGIDTIFPVESKRGALRYLIHLDYEDKYQYDLSEVQTFGRMSEDFKKAIEEDIDFQTKVTQVVELLDHNQYYLSSKDFILLVCSNDLFPVVVQMKGWAYKLLDEHNFKFSNVKN